MNKNIKELKIMNYNSNGIRRQKNEFVQELQNRNIDIAIITETKLGETDTFKIPNYTTYRNDNTRLQGGTAIVIKNSIKAQQLKMEDNYYETTGINIKIDGKLITIIAFRNQPNKKFSEKKYKKITDAIKEGIIAGDYNAKHKDWSTNSSENKAGKDLRKMLNNNPDLEIAAPDTPTRIATNSQSTIDFAILKNWQHTVNTYAIDALNSDHRPVILETTITGMEIPMIQSNKPTENNIKWEKYQQILNEIETTNIHTEEEINNRTEIITNKILEATQKARKRQNSANNQKQETLPREILQKIKDKNQLRKQYTRTRCPAIKTELNRATEDIKRTIKEYKEQKWVNFVAEKTNSDIHEIPRILKYKKQEIPALITEKGYTTTIEETIDHLGKTYEKQFTPNINTTPILPYTEETEEEENMEITKEELEETIKNMKNNKAPGLDNIWPIQIKKLPPKATEELLRIYNAALKTGHYPNSWKTAVIIPIHKQGKNNELAENYRPISLLSTLAKIFDKLILNRLKEFTDKKNIINKDQFGFRSAHSTTQQAVRIIQDMTIARKSKKITAIASLDVEKAFDKVPHEAIETILKHHRTPTTITNIINSYLQNRNFKIKIGETISTNEYKIKAGVPQGSALGPAIFNIFYNILNNTKDHRAKKATYADDTLIYVTSKHPDIAARILEQETNNIITQAEKWGMKINTHKTQLIYVNTNKDKPIKIQNTTIQPKQEIEYLGITIDKKLKFTEHIRKATKKATQRTNILRTIFKNKDINTDKKITIYKTYILPILTYGYPAWAIASKTNLTKLQKHQNKTLRQITGTTYRTSNKYLHNITGLKTMEKQLNEIKNRFMEKLEIHSNENINKLLIEMNLKKNKHRTLLQTIR